MSSRSGRLALWLGLLGAVLVGLHGLGGAIGPPPITDPGRLARWLDDRQPAEAVIALARLATIGGAWYLMAVTLATLATRALGWARLMTVVDLLSVPAVRRVVGSGVGLTMAAGSLVSAGAVRPAGASPAVDAPPAEAVVMRLLPDEAPSVPPARSAPDVEEPAPATNEAMSWEIKAGQHFWAVAASVLDDAWQRPPSDAEIVGYWRSLIEANRSVLADPANPDLLFPGQVLTLPVAPPSP